MPKLALGRFSRAARTVMGFGNEPVALCGGVGVVQTAESPCKAPDLFALRPCLLASIIRVPREITQPFQSMDPFLQQ